MISQNSILIHLFCFLFGCFLYFLASRVANNVRRNRNKSIEERILKDTILKMKQENLKLDEKIRHDGSKEGGAT